MTSPTTGRALQGAIGVLALVAVLELLSRIGVIAPTLLPPPSQVLADLATLLGSPAFLGDVASTLFGWAIGLSLASLIGVTAGLVLGSSRWAYEASSALIEFLRPIPAVALVPLAILMFGTGTTMKFMLVTYAALWPIMLNTLYGARELDPVTRETAKTFRLTWWQTLTKVFLPHAAPFAFTGIRISAAIALIVTVSAELLAGTASGIGSFILQVQAGGGSTSQVFAGTLVAGVLGVLVNAALRGVESVIFAWRKEQN
ncbi:NitT/TauT family transport system permease protein [Raineyella antarctica]|uniref:NitT/TauT family transport system permease protein n=1 Tax=Raineyella antarctica TaxID=1577474 RepID=A0A1G6GH69_9ACTN|nr:ABC transporter permease [Raineyella antarctica]SDB81290.1 NitT/TauT family transport system permease protein [Raineyella antarctica]